jgi:hypothetical protein
MARNQPTFSEIRSEVRRHLDDENGGVWTDAQLNRNINRAILQVWIDTEWETATSEIEGAVTHAWYALPSDSLIAKTLNSTDWSQEKNFPTSLLAMDKYDGGWQTSQDSIPSRWFTYSWDRFYVWPPVETNSGNRTMTLAYTPVPTEVTSDSSTTLGAKTSTPALYITELIPLKAAALSWLRQSWQKYLDLERQYQEALIDVQVKLRNTSSFHTTKLRPSGRFGKAHGNMNFKLRLR